MFSHFNTMMESVRHVRHSDNERLLNVIQRHLVRQRIYKLHVLSGKSSQTATEGFLIVITVIQ